MTSQVNGTKNGCIMKNFNKIFFAAVAAAFGLASCSQELTPVEKPQGNLVTVNFGLRQASLVPPRLPSQLRMRNSLPPLGRMGTL